VSDDIITNTNTFIQAVNTDISNIDVTDSFEEIFVKATQITVATETITSAETTNFNSTVQVLAPTEAQITSVAIESVFEPPDDSIRFQLYKNDTVNSSTVKSYITVSNTPQTTTISGKSITYYDISYSTSQYKATYFTLKQYSEVSGNILIVPTYISKNTFISVSPTDKYSLYVSELDANSIDVFKLGDGTETGTNGIYDPSYTGMYWYNIGNPNNANLPVQLVNGFEFFANAYNDGNSRPNLYFTNITIDETATSTSALDSLYILSNAIANNETLVSMVNVWKTDRTTSNSQYGTIDTWNTSLITDMANLFEYYSGTDITISTWNTESVENMSSMFNGCTNFNGAIQNWNTGRVTDMSTMFTDCTKFVRWISNWNTSSVTNMSQMFAGCVLFNAPIGKTWNTSSVINMSGMFQNCDKFNFQGESSNTWDTSKVMDMSFMFNGCDNFDGSIVNWNTSSVTTMEKMFMNCPVFNQPILTSGNSSNSWNTSSVTNMADMFYGCTNFNQDISNWNTSSVITMDSMFESCSVFDQDVRLWTVSTLTGGQADASLNEMFYSATAFLGKFNSTNSTLLFNITNGTPTLAFFDVSNTPISDISVNIGWNLLHITADGELSGSNIEAIYEYDTSSNQYLVIVDPVTVNTPTTVTTNRSYMVKTNSSSSITFTTILYEQPDLQVFNFTDNDNITVTSGWNLIGWNSNSSAHLGTMVDSSDIIVANTLHEYNVNGPSKFGLQTGTASIKANRGYWVKCRGNGTLAINKNT
jgi:surface protein